MTPIKTLLTLYYLCDQAAALRVLSAHEVAMCMENYDRLKLAFIDEPPARTGTRERAAQNVLGYRGFKAWEAANPDAVATLRQSARAQVLSR